LYEEISTNYTRFKPFICRPLDVVRDRIQKRRRSGEEHITMDYLEKCGYYDKLITATEIPHIQIDVSKHITIESVEDGLAYYDGWINEIFGFINGFEV
jgi:deoxyadenosine/deoxycytidine kinase